LQSDLVAGFLKGPKVLSHEQVEILRAELDRVIADRDNPDVAQPVKFSNINQAATPVWQMVNIWEASSPFRDLLSNATIVEEVAQLTASKELRVWHDQIQYKPAGDGGVNMWHQDWPYWPNIGPAGEQITAWVALDNVDESNGCMSMVVGSHRWGNNIDAIQQIKEFQKIPKEYNGQTLDVRLAPVQKGYVHYHHGMVWHGSHANTSDRPRRALALHYMTEKTCYVNAHKKGHPMQALIQVPENTQLCGEHFPLVWDGKKTVAVKPITSKKWVDAK
jgi:ectoine hydroxylase-related dioxygenase (phytanoyl-CoA dioxygenase family)